MKTIILTCLLIFPFLSALTGQNPIEGTWNGTLNIQGISLRIVFHVQDDNGQLQASMDSPDQGVTGIPVSKTEYNHPSIQFEIPAGGILYEGKLDGNEIDGIFKQGGLELPMVLVRQAEGEEGIRLLRPQEPIPPFPYHSEEVSFVNEEENIRLFGTLTKPKEAGQFPVVVLITGSGPQNRDSEIVGHKSFLVISDYLTRMGIAVLRYDERGVGESEGDFSSATSADFAKDVSAAVNFLQKRQDVNSDQIGLIGHSEGGIIAPMVAVENAHVSYIVLLAGSGIPSDELLLLQQQLVLADMGTDQQAIDAARMKNSAAFALIKNDGLSKDELKEGINRIFEGEEESSIQQVLSDFTSPWMIYFIRHDPKNILKNVKCPVLAVNGDKDLQVPAKENIEAIAKTLNNAGNTSVTTKIFPGLNHLFQNSETGSVMEYAILEETFSEDVLAYITQWILKTVGKQ